MFQENRVRQDDVFVRQHNCLVLSFALVLAMANVVINRQTRSTQRAQTSLAKADHYSHIAHCKNVASWL